MNLNITNNNNKRTRYQNNNNSNDRDVCIVSIARTPIGNLLGTLSKCTAIELGSYAIKSAVERSGIKDLNLFEEVIMGNVLSCGLGQAPARQAAILAGLPSKVPCTTINKVCASGMKSIIFAAQSIQTGYRDIVVAGGMESMSQSKHYIESNVIRNGKKFGDFKIYDSLQNDGLNDAYQKCPMGKYAELCAKKCNITRKEQDLHASSSYLKSKNAILNNKFKNEICSIKLSSKTKNETIIIEKDEEPLLRPVDINSLEKLRPVFQKENGTVTAGNASPISDGASAIVLMSYKKANELNIPILFKIKNYSDVAQNPEYFTLSPSIAINNILNKLNYSINDIDYFEINEAFSVVALANMKELKLKQDKVNIYGGAVALGHPLGTSGCRIVVTLCSILQQEKGKLGIAAVCNGGGGASGMLIEKYSI